MMTGEIEEKKGTCKYRMYNDKPCGRDLYDDKYCIFHSEDIEGKKADFGREFWEEFKRQEEEYNFDGFVFPGDISFKEKIFEKDVSFLNAKFSGSANFFNSQFSGEAHFGEAQFSGEVSFGRARFSGGVNFGYAQFSWDTYFILSQFSGEACFGRAQFSGWTDFGNAQFSGVADFGNAEFHSKSFFKNIKFENFNLCYMTDTSFYNVFGLLEYIAENRNRFKHPKGIKYLHDKLKPILGEPTVFRLPLLSREIRDDLYLMSFKDKHPWLFKIWWLFADCGRSFLRWALWAFGVALFFGLIYLFIGPTGFKPKPEGYTWFSFFYYSIVTFTTLGFGDITPVKWYTEILVTIEVILGYIMLGGLISILANKLARRS
jgi:uncharacterized protein YjbI with pentapeptide repeats